MALNDVPNPAKCKYHQKLRNSKKVLGCLVATNLQGACRISGHLFLGISGISGHSSRKFLRISRFDQFPRISVIIHEFTRNLRDFGHYYTHTHSKAHQRKRSNSTTVNYTKITQLIPSELFLCNLCVCNLEINSPIFFLCV